MNKTETEPDHRRWRNKRGEEKQLEPGEKRIIETDGAIRKSNTGKQGNVEEFECDPQKDRGLVTTNRGRWGGGRLISVRRRKRDFHDALKVRASLFILFGWSSKLIASLMTLSM
jgi:hypothetical protein